MLRTGFHHNDAFVNVTMPPIIETLLGQKSAIQYFKIKKAGKHSRYVVKIASMRELNVNPH